MKTSECLMLRGHLKIWESTRERDKKLVFDHHNIIVTQGKGVVMDWLAMNGYSEGYTIQPFASIVLTKNTAAEAAGDTWTSAVATQISNEGVLHVASGYTAIAHVEGTLIIDLAGTIAQPYGNNPANNHINSVCVCMGTTNTGGPGQAAYSASGNERLFSRVNVGDLIKTVDKSYTFTWSFTVS